MCGFTSPIQYTKEPLEAFRLNTIFQCGIFQMGITDKAVFSYKPPRVP